MVETAQDRDASLADLLRARARNASDTRLAADVGISLIVIIASLFVPYPLHYVVIEAALCFLAFGVWGIADREIQERADMPAPAVVRRLRLIQLAAIAIGGLAAVALALTLLGKAIGRVIS